MAKKVNGIKIYPRHSLSGLIGSLLVIVTALGVVFAITFLPIALVELNGATYQINGYDFADIVLRNNTFFSFELPSSIADITHLIEGDKYNQSVFESLYSSAISKGQSCDNFVISWFGIDVGICKIGDFVRLAMAASYVLVLVGCVLLLLVAIMKLIFGTYPKSAKGLSTFIFVFLFIFCLCSVIMKLCTKYIAIGTFDAADIPSSFGICYWQYVALGGLLLMIVVQNTLYKSAVKDKLFVPKAKKIKKNREIEE